MARDRNVGTAWQGPVHPLWPVGRIAAHARGCSGDDVPCARFGP